MGTLAWALALGCTDPGAHESGPGEAAWLGTGSGSIVAREDGAVLYAAFPDEGSVARVDRATGASDVVSFEGSREASGEPIRLALFGDRLLATLRAERALAVLQDVDGTLVEVERVHVGAEPVGVVADVAGGRAWVALSAQEEVVELDADLGIVRTHPVGPRPTWLALHPSGRTLYVTDAASGELTCIDVGNDPSTTRIRFPTLVGNGRAGPLDLARRLTGDPDVSTDGARLAVPGLWVDDISAPRGNRDSGADPSERYAALGLGLSPINPGVALVDLDATGWPASEARVRYAVGWAPDDPEGVRVVRSYLASVRFAAGDALLLAPMEGSATLAAIAVDDDAAVPSYGGFEAAPAAHLSTGAGPRGVAFAGDDVWIHTFLDRGLGNVPLARLRDALPDDPNDPAIVPVPALSKPVVPGVLDAVTEAGRGFFYGATDPRFVTASAGVSCATCHFEGRNDGMTWPTDHGIRSTPSLAGRVSDTVPLTWTAGVPSVFEEARLTSQERLGGRGATVEELAALVAFIDFTREVDVPERHTVNAQTERGRTLFERADVGCASCHWGPRHTDQGSHPLYGLEAVDTPSLTGVAATAPYLHDGRAPTLRDVLESARDGGMGDTSMLSEQDMQDLEAYLRTL